MLYQVYYDYNDGNHDADDDKLFFITSTSLQSEIWLSAVLFIIIIMV